jgi:hypothetical protein
LTEKIRGLEERVAQLERLLAQRSPDEESES